MSETEDSGASSSTPSVDVEEEHNNNITQKGGKNKNRNKHILSTKPEDSDTYSVTDVANAFADLKLAPQDHLAQLERVVCPRCLKKRKYFCYECLMPMGDPALSSFIPLSLPVSVDVIHHPTELVSKSTALHAKIISPQDVTVYEFPNFPEYNRDETLLLFPGKDSLAIEEIDFSTIRKVVFVDSQWQKTKRMLHDPKLQGLRCVRIDMQKTTFWRYQKCGDNCLATIEAIYYFFKEYQTKKFGSYNGEYDNLMYYYSYFYNIIQEHYRKTSKVFPRIDNYIK